MKFSIQIDEKGVAGKLAKAASQTIRKVALSIESDMKLLMRLPKTGRAYKRGKGGTRTHIASAPGEAPAVDTGNLIGSIDTFHPSETLSEVRIPPEYALYLEKGTSRMKPRPFVRPAIDGVLQRFAKGGIVGSLRP